jgi:hypothetical protein
MFNPGLRDKDVRHTCGTLDNSDEEWGLRRVKNVSVEVTTGRVRSDMQ